MVIILFFTVLDLLTGDSKMEDTTIIEKQDESVISAESALATGELKSEGSVVSADSDGAAKSESSK